MLYIVGDNMVRCFAQLTMTLQDKDTTKSYLPGDNNPCSVTETTECTSDYK